MALGAPFFPGICAGVGVGCGVSVGLGVVVSSGVAVAEGDGETLGSGVGDFFLRFDLAAGLRLGDGVGELFFAFGETEGDGLGVDFVIERFRCFRAGVGVGVGPRNFLIFVPNGSSAASGAAIVPNKIATMRKNRSIPLVAGNKDQPASS